MEQLKESPTIFYINSEEKTALAEFKIRLSSLIKESVTTQNEIIILCIGTDRATGDSLGPLIGYKLKKLPLKSNIFIYGTLKEPIHAKNLNTTIEKIYKLHKKPFIIAIDASLGSAGHVGYLTLGRGALKPGLGVKKNLCEVGDFFITGIVNISGFMDISILQNTRLNIVMNMADIISTGLFLTINQL